MSLPDTAYGWRAWHVPPRFGFHDPDPHAFGNDLRGLRYYLEVAGPFPNFTADELTRPHHARLAANLGLGERLLAPRKWWPRYAALLSIAQHLRNTLGSPITIRNAWRPQAYNDAVGGSQLSDHLWCLALDLDYKSMDHRREAEEWLKELHRTDPWLRLSLGLGARTTHVGILSAKGARTWKYASYIK